jgi:hypothetical protein
MTRAAGPPRLFPRAWHFHRRGSASAAQAPRIMGLRAPGRMGMENLGSPASLAILPYSTLRPSLALLPKSRFP